MRLDKAGIDLAEKLCEDDPVRKNIPYHWRVENGYREIFHLEEKAVACVAHLEDIPINEDELMGMNWGTISVFYTVWSKEKGLGRKVLFDTMDLLKSQHPNNRYVTMSPKTQMAMRFHTKNGAIFLQENPLTLNFEYTANFEYR